MLKYKSRVQFTDFHLTYYPIFFYQIPSRNFHFCSTVVGPKPNYLPLVQLAMTRKINSIPQHEGSTLRVARKTV